MIEEVRVPDIGDFDAVDVVEVIVSAGQSVGVDDPLITLESDKASMEVPSPVAGVVKEVLVRVGEKVGEGHTIVKVEVGNGSKGAAETPARAKAPEEPEQKAGVASRRDGASAAPPQGDPGRRGPEKASELLEKPPPPSAPDEAPAPLGPAARRESPTATLETERDARPAHASPAVRRFARELGVELRQVAGTGPRGRIRREDVQGFVKSRLAGPSGGAAAGGLALPPMPDLDFSKFGPVEDRELHKIRRVSAANLHRSWLHVPRVTQFDEADITELEAFRQSLKDEAARRNVKLTPLAFFMKATVAALREFPDLRSAWHSSGEKLILRNYYHLGIAVDTQNGLVVPVIRDVDQKGVWELAAERGASSERARAGKMLPTEVRGAVFSITSLGGIGGTGFTPIVNAPEAGILSISRSSTRPVWDGNAFQPRLVLPFGLTYDHRIVDGATAVRFTTFLAGLLGDVRRLLL